MAVDSNTRICPYPFSRLRLSEKAEYIPCCKLWLTDEYHDLDPGNRGEHWNSPAAQELRKRILNGDYSLCRRDACGIPLSTISELRANPKANPDAPLSASALQAISDGQVILPEGPESIVIAVDNRCNLSCPSCRSEHIFKLSDYEGGNVYDVELFLRANRDSIRVVYMSENGETFFSPWLRKKLQDFSPELFPNLDHIHVLTNGTLLTPKAFEDLKPGTDYIRKLTISIDAASEETYKRVRGGNWKQLLANLRWISELRKSGRFESVAFNYVLRKANMADGQGIIDLTHELGFDHVFFITFARWGVFLEGQPKFAEFEDEAVHLPGNPLREELMNLVRRNALDPKVHFQFPGGAELQSSMRSAPSQTRSEEVRL